MLTAIILAVVSVIVGIWVINKASKPKTLAIEEEPVGYESGSLASITTEKIDLIAIEPAPKKKRASKNTAKNKSLAKIETKSKKATKKAK